MHNSNWFQSRSFFIPFAHNNPAVVLASDPIARWHMAQVAVNDPRWIM